MIYTVEAPLHCLFDCLLALSFVQLLVLFVCLLVCQRSVALCDIMSKPVPYCAHCDDHH